MNSSEEINYLNMFRISNVAKERTKIQNLNFSVNGELYSYTVDDSLKVYSTKNKDLKNIITLDCEQMNYFQERTILHSKNSKIFYLSIYDNKYLAKFDNLEPVNSISTSPYEDIFMTVGSENSHIWDIRYKNPINELPSRGKIGTLGYEKEYAFCDNNFIYIFDRRNDRGPVITSSIPSNFFKNISYNYEGSVICLSAKRDAVFLNNYGELKSRITMEKSWAGEIQEDSNTFIYATSNLLFAYRILNNERVGQLLIQGMEHCNSLRSSPADLSFIFSTSDGSIFLAEKA